MPQGNTVRYPYQDAALSSEERALDLLGRLNTRQKVKQITCAMVLPIKKTEEQDLEEIGSFTLLGSQNVAEDIQKAQEYVIHSSEFGIPALVHCEALSGPASIPGANLFPTSLSLAATFEPALAEKMAEGSRKQLKAYGFRHALSPVADLGRDLRWGRCNEGYGEDPTLASEMTVAFVRGMQGDDLKEGIACTGKHFLGYSQSESAMNMHKSMASRRELREVFAKPFEAAIQKADLKCIMNCYSEVEGQPMCANPQILTAMLRDDMGFDGLVVSDYNSIRHVMKDFRIAQTMEEAAKLCLEAGLDVELPTRMGYTDALADAAERGEVSMERINEAARRVLKLKFELGLFEDPYPHPEDIAAVMDNTINNRYSLEAAEKSVTLMKNNGILPLTDTGKKIALIGPVGDCIRLLIGHYTYVANMEMLMLMMSGGKEVQPGVNPDDVLDAGEKKKEQSAFDGIASKMSTSNVMDKTLLDSMIRRMYPDAETLREALGRIYPNITYVEGCDYKGDDGSHIQEAADAAAKADVVILALGGKNGLGGSCTTGEAVDSASLDLAGMQELLMRAVYKANPQVILVHTDGRPLCSEWAYSHSPAIIEAWLPATYGARAIAEVISGKVNPSGRTPITVPRSAGHLPVYHYQNNGSSAAHDKGLISTGYIDSESSPLAPFGHGLSYTEFSYSDFAVEVQQDGTVTAAVTVENTGKMDGEEIVQLYGSDLYASIVRPRQELVGFRRIRLAKNEKKRVVFKFRLDQFAFENTAGSWVLEKGEFSFFIGSNSEDRRLTAVVSQNTTITVDPGKRCFYADTEVIPA